jgi:hypothetical protein
VIGYWLVDRESIEGKVRDLAFHYHAHTSYRTMGDFQPPIQWVSWVKDQEREADGSLRIKVRECV